MSTSDFGDQFQAMVKTWLDAQRQIGEGWLRTLSPFPESQPRPDGQGSGGARAERSKGSDAAQDSTSATGSLTEGLTAGYRAMVRMFELSFGSFTPGTSASSSGDTPGLDTFFSEWTRRMHGLMGIPLSQGIGAPTDISNLTFTDDDGDRSALSQFTDLYWDAYERTMGRLLESPSVGYRREFDQRLLRSSRAWLEFRRASFDYLAVLGEAWLKSLTEMMAELDSMTKQGRSVTTLVELLHLWTKVADRVLIDTFGQEEYSQTQGRLLNAAMAYRVEERKTADVFLKMSHLPSRSELDEVTEELHQLRRELRDLRRQSIARERGSAARKSTQPRPRTRKKPKPPAEAPDQTSTLQPKAAEKAKVTKAAEKAKVVEEVSESRE